MYSRITFILIYCSIAISGRVTGQNLHGKIIDSDSKHGIPFVQLATTQSQTKFLTDLNGKFIIPLKDSMEISHPFYETKLVIFDLIDSTYIIELNKKKEIETSEDQLLKGANLLSKFHEYLPQTSTTELPSFEFLNYTKIEVLEQSKDNPDDWKLLNSLETIEKNKFKHPDKKYARVVKSRYSDGDSSKLGFVPFNTYSVSESNEYIKALNFKYYNPLYKGAHRRYDYALIDSVQLKDGNVQIVYFRPKPSRRFVGFTGLLYFTGERFENRNGYYLPQKKKMQDFSLTFHKALTTKNTRFIQDFRIILWLKDIPNYSRNSKLIYSSKNTQPNFNVNNTSNSKWVDMALFNHEKDSVADDTWMMTQMIDKEKLEYIKKDTLDKKFVLSNTLQQMYFIYDGKIGYRARFFDINNVFAINKFESVRIGLGLQSHENLSDAFTFGGYFGYGIGDSKFKYGGNVGLYFGALRNNLLSVKYKRDLLEPGLVHYMDERQDLVKSFFTSRMDDYQSAQLSLRSQLNPYISTTLLLNNFSLKPLYEYIYNPLELDISETQKFNFTETSFLFNIGTPFSDSPNMRNILYRNKLINSNLFLNITKGLGSKLGGDFDYWKFNGKLNSNIQLNRQSDINIVLDGGVMTKDQPYPIMYGGPGTEFKLTGIIINNAFQTMQLYGFFTDRYVHSFIDYNFGNVIFRKSKFKPELSLAFNLGWGIIEGRKEIHENIEVRDYPNGYFETGIILNNLLRLKIYKYFYGGLGVGAFVGYGPDAENGSFAIRISYEIGTL